MNFIIEHKISDLMVKKILINFFKNVNVVYLNFENISPYEEICFTNVQLEDDFKSEVEVYLSESEHSELELGIYFAKELSCNVVISDDSINPFSYLVINKLGKVSKCYLIKGTNYSFEFPALARVSKNGPSPSPSSGV